MKTAIILSCLLVGGSILNTKLTEEKSAGILTYKISKAKRVSSSSPSGQIRIVVDKSDYELHVYDAQGWYATYPVVFGNSTLSDKKMEGDKNTPEGGFKINSKKIHNKWSRFIGIDYPTKESLAKFEARKRKGEIPANARPGGAIGIHGTWPREDFVVDRYKNWTEGCISLKRADVEELYSYVPINTPISIRR